MTALRCGRGSRCFRGRRLRRRRCGCPRALTRRRRLLSALRGGFSLGRTALQARLLGGLALAPSHLHRIATVVLSHGAQDALIGGTAQAGWSDFSLCRSPARRSARAFGGRGFAASDFEPVAAVDRLDVENLAPRDTEHAFYGSRHVLVHPVGELDYDNRAFARGPNEPPAHRAGALSKLPKDDVHVLRSSITWARVYCGSFGFPRAFSSGNDTRSRRLSSGLRPYRSVSGLLAAPQARAHRNLQERNLRGWRERLRRWSVENLRGSRPLQCTTAPTPALPADDLAL
jgi:hypothetical protein